MKCRLCLSELLTEVIDLGEQKLSGFFPEHGKWVDRAPLKMVKCGECNLHQLDSSLDIEMLYGDHYGYRSGLNGSMVRHLRNLTDEVLYRYRELLPDDGIALDIGSNDGTLLKHLPSDWRKVGVDPHTEKFAQYYAADIVRIPGFFSSKNFEAMEERFDLVFSIAMFYDVEDPIKFAYEVSEVMAPQAVWVIEVTDFDSICKSNSYDAICHEHILYYTHENIERIVEAAGLRVAAYYQTKTNGGSTVYHVVKKDSDHDVVFPPLVTNEHWKYRSNMPARKLNEFAKRHSQNLSRLLRILNQNGQLVLGYGASTKGNVMLQNCSIGPSLVPYVAEVNEDKFGCETSTGIPIIPDKRARDMRPDYFLVMPWHFKDDILSREQEYMDSGGQFIFPLPEITII